MPGHPVRPAGNGDEMLVKDSASSICMQSSRKYYKRLLRHGAYRDLMNTGSLPRGFLEPRLKFVKKRFKC